MSGTMTVVGGQPLYGTVRIPAAKNSVLPLLAASLLCEGTVRLCGVPRLSDVEASLALLRGVGCEARRKGSDLVVEGPPQRCRLPEQEAGQMRASILFAAPLLARLGRVETVFPGGCCIGARPIDLHIDGLRQMGAQMQPGGAGRLVLTAPGGLHGVEYTLRLPSVGATETLLLAAATARGRTTLRGAACEPEIVDLANFLNLCGARIEGAGTPVIRVEGRRCLMGAVFAPLPDRIFASTIACAVAAAGGRVKMEGCRPATFRPVLGLLSQMGCTVERAGSRAEVTVARLGRLLGVGQVSTGVYPGLATDAAPLLAAALLRADSPSSIRDQIFERRFGCAEGFARMGARVRDEGRILHIEPTRTLCGARVEAPDLRGGAALVVAALGARGTSRIEGMEYIQRGYADLGDTLSALGARIA